MWSTEGLTINIQIMLYSKNKEGEAREDTTQIGLQQAKVIVCMHA